MKQLSFDNGKYSDSHGGALFTTRAARARLRPVSTKHSMHLVLRSSKAYGKWSFTHPKNRERIRRFIKKTTTRYGVKLYSIGLVGNHIHFHLKLNSRQVYLKFIKSLTTGLAMLVSGASWKNPTLKNLGAFFDYRPFTRIVVGLRSFLALKDYVALNQLEGFGVQRNLARLIIKFDTDDPLGISV